MNGKVLITGGHGNLGSWLTKEFCKSGYDVYVLTRSAKTKIPNIQYKLIEADVTDYEGLSKKLDLNFDFCIHTASFNEYFLKDYPKKSSRYQYTRNTKPTGDIIKKKNKTFYLF